MPSPSPIACSLGPADLEARLTALSALGADALLAHHRQGAHAELRFAAAAGVRRRIDAIVAAESACCPFLTLTVREQPGAIELRIDGPDEAALAVAQLADAFRAAQQGGRRSRLRP